MYCFVLTLFSELELDLLEELLTWQHKQQKELEILQLCLIIKLLQENDLQDTLVQRT